MASRPSEEAPGEGDPSGRGPSHAGTGTRGAAPRSSADLIAGLVFIGFGVAFGVASLRYELGSLLRMGPGYVPLLIAGILAALGAAVAVKAYVAPDMSHLDAPGDHDEASARGLPFGSIAWRPIVTVTAALLFFAMTIDGLGLLPATLGTAVIVSFASRDTTVPRALLIAAGLTAASLLIFVVLLQLRLALLGDWLGG